MTQDRIEYKIKILYVKSSVGKTDVRGNYVGKYYIDNKAYGSLESWIEPGIPDYESYVAKHRKELSDAGFNVFEKELTFYLTSEEIKIFTASFHDHGPRSRIGIAEMKELSELSGLHAGILTDWRDSIARLLGTLSFHGSFPRISIRFQIEHVLEGMKESETSTEIESPGLAWSEQYGYNE